jgi:hypothetical protein
MKKIFEELQGVTSVELAEGQSNLDFWTALVKAADKVTAEEWESLSDLTQTWVNIGQFCLENGEDIPDPNDKAAIKVAKAAMAKADMEAADATVKKEAKKANSAAKKSVKSKSVKAVSEKELVAGKSKSKGNGGGRGRKGLFPLDAKIKVLAKENPHRKGTILHKYFDKYKTGMTVQTALDAGIVWANLRYLNGRELIQVG